MLCDVPVLGLPNGIPRVVRSTGGSSTAATSRTLNATSNLGLCVRKASGRRGVLRVGSAGSVGSLEDHVGARLACTTTSERTLINQEQVGKNTLGA